MDTIEKWLSSKGDVRVKWKEYERVRDQVIRNEPVRTPIMGSEGATTRSGITTARVLAPSEYRCTYNLAAVSGIPRFC